ncbi:MAG: leucine-rich repeat domain-containing protein [Clostridiales bacterium]|nr:leucine-rich repeat domain-containing protein [Clostridiales bacterium]
MTDKKKKYDIVHKGVCSYPQTENFVAVKQFLIINEDGKRYLLVKLTNNRTENVTGATLFVEQYDDRGDKISADSVHVGGFDGYPQKSFAVERKIPVASTCVDCRVTVTDAEFGKYTYSAGDELGQPGYIFEPDEPEVKVPAEIMKKAGKSGVTVEPRSLKMPVLILLISLVMIVAAFVSIWIYTDRFVQTEDRFLHDGVYYSFEGGDRSDGSDIYVVGVRGARSEISVPAEIEGHKVVRVDAGAFLGNKYIKKVAFGGEIAIGVRAFFGCTALESIDLKNVTHIATDAFSGCTALRSVELEKIFDIGSGAFNRCTALTSLKIADGDSDLTVGKAAFSDCENLRTVDISRTVIYGGSYALFDNCLNVTSLHLKNFECGRSERNITALFGGKPALSSIIIDNIDTVGAGLCEGLTALTAVRFNDVTTPNIGACAFKACENLKEVVVPAAVTAVGDEAFCGTAITAFDGSALEFVGYKAFFECKSLATFTMNKDTELTAIGEQAFFGCERLRSVTIPTQAIAIGEQAFSGCKQLSTVTFDDESKIAAIENSMFEGCERLNSINIPAAVRAIGDRAFSGCAALADIALPFELAYIGEEAFSGAGLIEARLPASVVGIGLGAFGGCEKLRLLSVPFVGGSRGANSYLPYIFGAESTDDSAAVMPVTLNTVFVTQSDIAPNNAFYGCAGLTSVVYNNGPTAVGENAFRGCRALTKIEFADGLESIGARAFSGCESLIDITLPDTLTSIGRNAFSGCTSLQTLTTPFVGASRSSNGFLAYMFGGESSEDFDKVPASLKKVELTDTVTVGAGAFSGTAIREVVLGNATTAIESNAFMGNRKLNVITLPVNLADIGNDAFLGCYFLYEVYNFSGLPLTAGEPYYGYVAYYALKVHVIEEPRLSVASCDGYDFVQNEDKWYLVRYPDETEELVLPTAVVTDDFSFTEYAVHDRLFIDDKNITSVQAPSNVTSIGRGAFYDCIKLETFAFPSGITTVADELFFGCAALGQVSLPSAVDRIGDSAFFGCAALKEITVPSGCSSIGIAAFGGCVSLIKADLPSSCYEIGAGAFGGCIMLCDVGIPNTCRIIGDGAFSDCRRIKSVTLPVSLERIGGGAFSGCIKLFEVYNLCRYVLNPGDEHCGGVAYNAYAVHSSVDEAPLDSVIINGLHYYRLGGKWYLVDYYGVDGDIDIGGFVFGTERVDDIIVMNDAFRLYDNIKSIKIGKEVSRIGSRAFGECKSLESLVIASDKLIVNGGAFSKCAMLTVLTVLSGDVEFGAEAFMECGLTSVSLTGGDIVIMDNAFSGNFELDKLTVDCKSLAVYETAFFDALREAEIKCSGGFTAEYGAFYGSLIYKLRLQADDVVISDQSFFGYDIAQVDIAGYKSVYISTGAFNSCGNLAALSISGKVIDIAEAAFDNCADFYSNTGVGEMSISAEEINISAFAFTSCIMDSLAIEGNRLALSASAVYATNIGKLGITCYGNQITVVGLLDSSTVSELVVRGKKVEIADSAFYMSGNFTSVDIAAEDLIIADSAFFNQTALETITLAASKTAQIGRNAFAVSGKFKSLVLPNALTTVSESAFAQCASLQSVVIPNGVTGIGDNAFSYCFGLEELTLPNGLVSIGDYAFQNCSRLKSLTIPNTVESVGIGAFMSCNSLERLVLSSALTEICEYTFCNCESLTEINLPANITAMGQSAFFGCRTINSLTIPHGVTEIPASAFAGCNSLTDLTIPNSVTSIDFYAFSGCEKLTSLNLPSTLSYIGGNAFSDCNSLTKLTIPSGVSSINFGSFAYCYALTELTLPNGLTTIGDSAFIDCSALTKLTLPSSLTSIGDRAFSGCVALTELTVNASSALGIGDNAFSGCSSLTKLELKNIREIGFAAFSGCTKLESLSLHLTERNNFSCWIGSQAFENCFVLKNIDISSVANIYVYIDNYAFSGCGELTTLDLPSTLYYIGADAFRGCSKLQYLELPSLLSTIDDRAFYGAKSLFAVCNKSNLNIRVGSENYGGVAKYAVVVTDDPERARLTYVESGTNKFVIANGVWYLYECEIDNSGYGLPESVTTSAGVIDSYVIKSGTFDYLTRIVIPKSVSRLQDYAFEAGVGIVYYRGTAEKWSEICGSFSEEHIYFYAPCVHYWGEWTEIDGAISTVVTMSAWTVVKDATCTETGKLERHCDRCGATQEQEVPINPNAHDYDENGRCKNCGTIAHDDNDYTAAQSDNGDGERIIND